MLTRSVSCRLGFSTVGLAVVCLVWACQPTNQGYAPSQPVAYSHAVHAGGLEIPCLYCHHNAEKGPNAGVPSADLCMNCHRMVLPDHPEVQKVARALERREPIAWVRVHRLPAHAAFDHSIHVRRGVSCQTCHGPIETMGRVEQWEDLTMGWCLDCHRSQPSATVTASVQVGSEGGAGLLWEPRRATTLTDCTTCHH